MVRLMSKAELMGLFEDIIEVIVGHDELDLYLDWWDPGMETGVMREADNAMLGQLMLLNLTRFPRDGGTTGILLMSTGKQNEYLRVGMFRIWFWGMGNTSQISEEAKLTERGWEKRTITIV